MNSQVVYWNKDVECMPREKLEALQLERLKKLVKRVYEKVPFYKQAFKDAGVKVEDLQKLSDLENFPFTTKNDLRDNYPFNLFAEDINNLVRIHCSSGTTGKPTVVGYTRNDIDVWAEVTARSIGCAGGTSKDILQVAYGYGLFTGGLGLHYGGEKVGAAVIPISGGNTKRQLMLMEDFGSTIIACTPSYALYLAESLREAGIDRNRLKLRVGILGAEPWSDNMRQEIEEKFQIDAIDIYGLSEIMGPGVACECLEKKGLHVFEDHFIPEIIDPQNGRRLPPGELGELVFTTLTKEALPLIRYRTRDITRLIETECECGRTHVKIDRISGRTDDMLIIRGVNVFPSQIESVLLSIGGAEPHYQLIVDRARALDQLEIKVEVSEALFSDEVRKLEALQSKIEREIEHVLGISVSVTLVEPKTIPRSEGKAQRIIDKRKL